MSYCLTCKDDTKNKKPYVEEINGRTYLKSSCSDCGGNKCKIMPKLSLKKNNITKNLKGLGINDEESDEESDDEEAEDNYTPNEESDEEEDEDDDVFLNNTR